MESISLKLSKKSIIKVEAISNTLTVDPNKRAYPHYCPRSGPSRCNLHVDQAVASPDVQAT
jgi:hypothetical protein